MRAFLILSVGVLAACRAEPPTAVGRLDRPSGLAAINRGEEAGSIREDLLVVDSEAEGVKIVQYNGERVNFVQAPVVFFPLIISAPGFPTEIAAPSGDGVNHAFVLASGASMIHLIDVSPLAFGDIPIQGNVLIRSIDTLEFAPGLIPTDLEVVQSGGDVDLVAVSFEGVSAADQLMILQIDRTEHRVVGSATIAASPRRITVRGLGSSDVRVLASSGTSSVSEVRLDLAAANKIAGVRQIFVGGPTADMADAGPQGAFAIRSDRPRVVHLLPSAEGLVRSTAPDDSPLTPFDERGTADARGTLDVHDSPIGAAAIGRVPILIEPNPRLTVALYTGINETRIEPGVLSSFSRSDGPIPVLMLAHADGFISFVVVEANTASIATSLESSIVRVSTSTAMTIEAIDPEAGNSVVGACASTDLCPATELGAPGCPTAMVRHDIPSFGTYRATYRGPLAKGQAPAITKRSSTQYTVSDPAGFSFEDRMVQVGDNVLLQVQSQNCADLESPAERIGTGAVAVVSRSTIDVVFDEPFEFVEDCGDDVEEPALSQRYEVYPGDDVMVLARYDREDIIEVVERAPVVSGPNGSVAEFTERLAMRISSPSTFECLEGTGRTACAQDIDCGTGRSCADAGEIAGCPRTCTDVCAANTPSCIDGLVGRRCTTAEIEVFPTVPFVIPTAQVVGTEAFPSVAPESATFSTVRQTFTISFPGSRTLVEVLVTDTGPQLFHIR